MPKTFFNSEYTKKMRDSFKDQIPGSRSAHLCEAIADGFGFKDYNTLRHALSQAVHVHGVATTRDFDVGAFARRMAEAGTVVSESYLKAIEDEMRGLELVLESGSQAERIVPLNLKRANEIAAALCRRFDLSEMHGQMITAAFHGFGSMRELEQAIAEGPAGTLDEDCEPHVVNARIHVQGIVLARLGGVDPETALTAIEILRPTARRGASTLEALDARLDAHRRADPRQKRADSNPPSMAELLAIAKSGDLAALEALLKKNPNSAFMMSLKHRSRIASNIWLQVLEHCGWQLVDVDELAFRDLDRIASVRGPDGTIIPIHLSALAYVPGEVDNRQVEDVKRALGETAESVVLIFNQPLYWPPDSAGWSMLYGGLLLMPEMWSHFVLRPGGGFKDVLQQRGRFSGSPDATFIRQFGCREAATMAGGIAGAIAGVPPMTRIVLEGLQTPHGWLLPAVRRV